MTIKDKNGKDILSITAADLDNLEGVWFTLLCDDGSRPCLTIAKNENGFYIGVCKDSNNPGMGMDLAIGFDKEKGPEIQAIRGKEVEIVNLFNLLGML